MVFKSCGSMLLIVAVVVWGSIVQGAFLAVILHPEGKAMDSASISFRQEQGLMLRKGQDFPNSFHSGWDSFLRRLTSIHPKRIFMSSKT